MKKIYGITEIPNDFGLQAYAIDGDTGEVIEKHFCSNESFAKSDLGFNLETARESESFYNKCLEKYKKLFGKFELIWVGDYQDSKIILELRKKNRLRKRN